MIRRIQKTIIALINIMLALSVSASPLLSEDESLLAEKISFDRNILEIIKQSGHRIEALTGINQSGNEIIVSGLSFVATEHQSSKFMQKYSNKIQALGYQLFRQERGYGYTRDRLAIIKSSNMYDILRIRKTHAYTDNLSTEKIITKLKHWDKQYGLSIIGAGYNWLNLKLDRLPESLPLFADEVLAFCPDVLSFSAGTVTQLQQEIKADRMLFLRWN